MTDDNDAHLFSFHSPNIISWKDNCHTCHADISPVEWCRHYVAFSSKFIIVILQPLTTSITTREHEGFHNQAPRSFSSTAAASKRPITRKMFIRSVTAESSLCMASHKSNICSVGLPFVAKKLIYLKNIQKKYVNKNAENNRKEVLQAISLSCLFVCT